MKGWENNTAVFTRVTWEKLAGFIIFRGFSKVTEHFISEKVETEFNCNWLEVAGYLIWKQSSEIVL